MVTATAGSSGQFEYSEEAAFVGEDGLEVAISYWVYRVDMSTHPKPTFANLPKVPGALC